MGTDQILETSHRNPLYDEDLNGLIDAGSLEESFNDVDAQNAVGSILQNPLGYNGSVPEIVVSLGNGLALDGSGQVYIPASAVSEEMLGFDTATRGELDSHESDAGAHHSPPTLRRQEGSVTSSGETGTQEITFETPYQPDSFIAVANVAGYDHPQEWEVQAGVDSVVTDSEGMVVGINVWFAASSSIDSITLDWQAYGEVA